MKKLRQHNGPHTGNKGFPVFDIKIYFARQTQANLYISLQNGVGGLGVADLDDLKWFNLKTLILKSFLDVVDMQHFKSRFGGLCFHVIDDGVKIFSCGDGVIEFHNLDYYSTYFPIHTGPPTP